MTHYRIYGLNEDGGIIRGGDYMFERDEEATAAAQELLDSFSGAEVWAGKRRLTCLKRDRAPGKNR